ncbi:protease inhibitor Inh/omp19 family protein [Stappia sp. F7233]|uniref:Protease inhibitor Inh/omp19 family protein n=1 Tax=Stappia albiluteola TaxID=2758565 RepID=A0A839AED3_9HYPH|nr:protease inhibitor Inh/omp19 family protein [Stappia albiluteola]MBA5776949.1 protease inhibitor Inh/omp19 family protein [Stappia albiluteola]
MNRHLSLAFVVALAIAAAGCQRLGWSSSRPAPLPATPTPPVASEPLAPLPGTEQTGLPSDQQQPFGTEEQQVAAAPLEPPADAKEIGRSDLLGGWSIASGADNCKLFMTLTTWSGGYRANSRGCNSSDLQRISAWDLSGKQVVLKDESGATVAQLYSAGAEQFSGQTSGGQAISVYR